jgi:uncharacterized protein
VLAAVDERDGALFYVPPTNGLTPYIIGGTHMLVKITFDPAKRAKTFAGRGLDFVDAALVFEGETLNAEDRRQDYGETRMQTVGFLDGRMVMIVWTPRHGARHIISMRKCNAKEQARHRQRFDAR